MKTLLLALTLAATALAAEPQHLTVAAERGKFLGWPANHGPMRVWGEEIVVAFTAADFKVISADRHALDDSKPQHTWLARSLDSGATWRIEKPDALRGHKDPKAAPIGPTVGGIRSASPDCMIFVDYEDEDRGRSWFHVSQDRGRSWGARQALPDLGLGAINGRTDYVLKGADDALFAFITPKSTDKKEGRVFAARTDDGGQTWTREGLIGPDLPKGYNIQPSTVRLDAQRLVCVTRRQEGDARSGIDIHASSDDGKTWRTLGTATQTGKRSTAGDMILMRDGRLALTYAQRDAGTICVRYSADDGATWSVETVLRSGSGNWDIGYTRLAQRADGKLISTYYWNIDPLKERTIEATIWMPPAK